MKFFSKKDEFFDEIEDKRTIGFGGEDTTHTAPDVITKEEVLSEEKRYVSSAESTGALEALRKRMISAVENRFEEYITEREDTESEIIKPQEQPKETVKETKTEKKVSLLDKCMPYILDENGQEALDSEPIYKLQSVADILRADSQKTIEMLSQKYEVAFDDLGHSQDYLKPSEPENEEPVIEDEKEPEKSEEKLHIKNIQSNVPFIISDIDTPEIVIEKPKNDELSNTATITFTPVSDGKNDSTRLSVSTQTRSIDLTGELAKMPERIDEIKEDEVLLEKNEFEDFVPDEEFVTEQDGLKLIKKYSIKKKNAFLQAVFSALLCIVLAVMKIPAILDLLYQNATVSMIICSVIAGLAVILNADMFVSVPKMFTNKANQDSFSSLSAIFVTVFAVVSILQDNLSLDMLLLLTVMLFVRAISKFFKASYILSNLKVINTGLKKKAVRLISDEAVTFAMAKNAIEGDVLIAAPKETRQIEDYMKYTSFGTVLGGRIRLITILSLLLSVIVGFASFSYFDGLIYGIYSAAAIQCLASLPTVFLIDTLPLYRAAKKLNRKGAMIAGKMGAEQIEMANAIVLNSCDLFPSGTVTLHQLKVLKENDLQDTLIRAASLTESLGSTLAPIFKKIAGTGVIETLPDSDTVKYEDKMGISGWVDNRLLFIGNRTLMEAHGIAVPSVEVDRQILRNGYFPVYVATGDKACALLVIQYNVDATVARELRKLTALGVTLLINSSDPNLTEEMICDYLGLYNDSVKVMSAAGCHMYNNAVMECDSISAPAAYKGSTLTLASIVNCASKIKRSNLLLTVVHIISIVFGVLLFAYVSLGGSGNLMSESTVLIYGLVSTVLAYLVYLAERP